MKNVLRFVLFTVSVSAFILFGSCATGTGDADESYEAERRQMLKNVGNNIILPAYNDLQNNVNDLQVATNDFSANPTAASLASLQEELKMVRLAWQDTSPFQFGPAESVLLRTSLNTYPTDTAKVNDYITSGSYSLGSIDSRNAAGFPALDYLLHGLGSTNQEITLMYTDDANASNRIAYLQDNVNFIKEKVDAVVEAWSPSGGDYIGAFLSDDKAGTDMGSSLGMLVNSFVLQYERFLRDGKIGIPAGVKSAGHARPTSTEAYYGGYSVELAVNNLNQIENIFTGGDKIGLDDNLTALGAESLAEEIKNEIGEAQVALEQLSDPLSKQIEENNEVVQTAFQEMHELVALFKVDMTSVLGITITYQDNDGD